MADSRTAPCEHIVTSRDTGLQRLGVRILEDGTIYINRHNDDGELVENVVTIDNAGDIELSGDVAITGDVTVTGGVAASGGTIGVVNYRTVAEDVVPTIGLADAGGVIELLLSTSGAKAILTDVADPNAVDLGQEVTIFLTARGGGSYTLALSTGTLTFDAALECAKIVRTSLGWNVVSLNGATIV